MPYKVVKRNGKHCILKFRSDAARSANEGGETVEGSCHANREDTIGMMQAIQISEHKDYLLKDLQTKIKDLAK